MSEANNPTVLQESPGLLGILVSHWLTVLVVVVALIVGFVWWTNAFHDRGYAPEQPINFSHKIHAGNLKIDCQYCHFNAPRGNHAGVPPMSVCLGCHGTDKGAVANDKPEVQKLLDIAKNGGYIDEHTQVAHEGGVVHWNRVHKLPDFVYFPHRWHIEANVACQTCHGPVEEMPVVRQHATLTMGWCLDCHRKTNYVGGPGYRPEDPASFTVGTANYDVQRLRIQPDAVAEFVDRPTAANPGSAHDAGHGDDVDPKAHAVHASGQTGGYGATGGESGMHQAGTASDPLHEAALKHLLEANPGLRDMPRWRLVDLPETHRAIYQELVDQDVQRVRASGREPDEAEIRAFFLRRSFMNSPTQCSTCHQ